MKRITVELLRKHNACENQVKTFTRLFPKGAPISVRSLNKAIKTGLDMLWLECLLTGQTRVEYDKVRGPARAKYEKIKGPAWAEYEKVRGQALVKVLQESE